MKPRRVLLAAMIAVTAVAAGMALAAGDALDRPLAGAGDAQRGRGVFVARDGGHCVICHAVSGISPAGSVGPALDGVALRLTAGQIRQRIVDITRANADAAMPAFFRRDGLARVAPQYIGTPLLAAQDVEDLVAFLGTLQ